MTDEELCKRLLDFDKVTVGDARDAALRIIRDRQYYRMGPGITAQVIARATLAEIEVEKT
jgi:hypothetical protein